MIIEDPEKFKTWLTAKLEPLCDADPAALAKYVYALAKKDRPIDELKTSMRDQLEVFLQKETDGFVNALFEALETSEFENKPAQKKEEKEEETSPKDSIASKSENGRLNEPDLREVLNAAHENKREAQIKEAEKDDKPRPARTGRRVLSPDLRRPRSPYERRRTRSRSRDRDRSTRWRNKSPPRRHELRRRSYSKSPRRFSRTPPKRPRYRNRSPPPRSSNSRTRSPFSLPSPDRDRDGKLSPDLVSRDTDLRLPIPLSSSQLVTSEHNQPRRCRDYDEKGFCMRGDLCPFDHGNDPVILEDLSRGGLFNGAAAALGVTATNQILSSSQLLHSTSPSRLEYNPSAVALEPRFNWRRYHHRSPHNSRGMSRGLRLGPLNSVLPKRELISVVTSEINQSDPSGNSLEQPTLPAVTYKSQFETTGIVVRDKQRYEPYAPRRVVRVSPSMSSNCTLQLKKIPAMLNNISQLNNHFSKFGKIINILVGFDNDPESALVTFSSHIEASAAYKSSEAVLNNRFIKVFWHNPNNVNNENKPESAQVRVSMLEKLSTPAAKILHNLQPSTVPSSDRETSERSSDSKKKHDDLQVELRKRKQVLLEKQITHQKLLIQRIESGNVNPEQKATIMDSIKSLQESIESLKKEVSEAIMSTTSTLPAKPKTTGTVDSLVSFRKTKEETQRQLLDAEMDLLKHEQQGSGNIVEIRKRITDLKIKAHQMKIHLTKISPHQRGGYRGRGSSTRGRGALPSRYVYNVVDYNVVDHRPTKLLVSGYEEDDKEEVLTHFNKFGEIADYTSDDATPSLILNYKSRKEAEVALLKGRNFQDRLLSVTWATPNHNIRPGVTTQNIPYTPKKESTAVDPLQPSTEEQELASVLSPSYTGLQEEEDDNENRAWRR